LIIAQKITRYFLFANFAKSNLLVGIFVYQKCKLKKSMETYF